MKIKKLKLNNFLSHAVTEVDFGQITGPLLIGGKFVGGQPGESNGAGKSSLFDAINYSLFGVTRAKSDDDLIRLGYDDMSVTHRFEIDGVDYEIVRSKKRGKSQKVAFSDLTNDRKLTGNSVKETEAKITDVLGMDYTIFSNTVFSPQGQLALFPSQLSSKRKEVLSAILELDAYVDVEDKARRLALNYERDAQALEIALRRMEEEAASERVSDAQITQVETEVQALGQKMGQAKANLDAAQKKIEELRSRRMMFDKLSRDLDKLKEDLVRIERQTRFQVDQRTSQLVKIDSEEQSLKEQIDREPRLRAMIIEIEGRVKTYDEVAQRLGAMKEERAGLSAERDGLRRQTESAGADLQKLRDRLNKVQELGPRCPTCYSQLTEDAQKKITDDIIQEGTEKRKAYDDMVARYSTIDARVSQIDKELLTLAMDIDQQGQLQRDLTRAQSSLDQIGWAKTQQESLGSRRAAVETMYQDMVRELEVEKATITSRQEKAAADLGQAKVEDVDLVSLNCQASVLQTSFGIMVQERDEKSQVLGSLRSKRDSFLRKSAQIETDRTRFKEAKDQEFVYKELTRAFGRNGIPALIMDNALAEVQAEVNQFMDDLTGGKIKVEFQTQREQKSGKLAETLDIIVSDGSGARDFALYSGGEKARVALAIRLALSRVISRRAGKRIECVMIDEVSDLDPAGVQVFSQMVNRIAQHYKQIMVVTHLPELQSQFSNSLTIVNDRGVSHIETEAS